MATAAAAQSSVDPKTQLTRGSQKGSLNTGHQCPKHPRFLQGVYTCHFHAPSSIQSVQKDMVLSLQLLYLIQGGLGVDHTLGGA